MSEKTLVQHCSPTLAGMKTGSMFLAPFTDGDALRDSLRRWNRFLVEKGLRILPLRYRDGKALLYVYRPAHLRRDLAHATACRLLEERGYRTEAPTRCVRQLIHRIGNSREFPHEVGLFLGYPPEDVRGFIEEEPDACKCVGCWKVYDDVEAAQRLFAKYRKCTHVYRDRLERGGSLDRLTVAG